MDIATMNVHLANFLGDCLSLASRKNRDYHPDNVAYLEILQTAFETNITVEQDLWARFRKQLSALRRYVIEQHVESESPISRMHDVANYMAILAVWTEHKTRILRDAFDFVRDFRTCDCVSRKEQPELCDRCQFLSWLARQHEDLVSRETSSPLTPKPPA